MNSPDDDKTIEALEAIFEDAALAEAADAAQITPEDRAWADGMRSRMQERIAELRRSRLPKTVTPVAARPIRPSYLAMARDALEATLDVIMNGKDGQAQIACRNLSDLTDDDLRRLLETLDAEPE